MDMKSNSIGFFLNMNVINMPIWSKILSLMNLSITLVFIFASAACTWVGGLDELRSANRQNLIQLQIGMTKQEVIKLMGTDSETDHYANYEQLTVTNPYKSESYQAGGNTLEVLYYYTDKKTRDQSGFLGMESTHPDYRR